MKDINDLETRELPVKVDGRALRAILGRRMTPAERQERSRLLRSVALVERLDGADEALRLIDFAATHRNPDLEAGIAGLRAHLAGLRVLLKQV